jgi:hypothetical protein
MVSFEGHHILWITSNQLFGETAFLYTQAAPVQPPSAAPLKPEAKRAAEERATAGLQSRPRDTTAI